MANTLTRYAVQDVGTSPETVRTVPTGTTMTIVGLVVANTTASQVAVTLTVAGSTVVEGLPLPAGGAYEFIDAKIVASAGDTVVVTSDTAASVDVLMSVLEQT